MRADVKLGVMVSAGIVLIAGGYYLWRSPGDIPIPLDATTPTANRQVTAAPSETPPAPSRPTTPNPRTAPRNRTPANPSPEGATRPVGQPSPRVATRPASQAPHTASQPQQTEPDSATRRPVPAQGMTENPSAERPPVRRTPVVPRGLPSAQTPGDSTPAVDRARESTAFTAQTPATSGAEAPVAEPTVTTPVVDPVGMSPDRVVTTTSTSAPANESTTPSPPSRDVRSLTASTPATTLTTSATPTIPSPSSVTANAAIDTHIIQPGDSFAALARKYYGHERFTDFLVRSNPQMSDPTALRVGASLRIPPKPDDADGSAVDPLRPSTGLSSGTTPAQDANRSSLRRTYRVRAGDTFYAIARDQLGDSSRWKELLELNKSLVQGDPTMLRAGQEIALPPK